eukprot:TRINITY_DN34555_c0_g1_i1.p1 TRINITY_DN34555_c0_g1~~TRINITY_DN34555_c0_g1_i1.p1  ORF type:complete len:824 (-),score=123.62 TRINITY_DN34555_c0_g1_i1:91-2562(-)
MAAESVCVGVRVRPYNAREKGLNAELCIDMNGPTTTITNPDTKEAKPFTFDESFWSHDGCEDDGTGYMTAIPGSKYADQRYVFNTFGQRVLDNAWNGFHCCLFAYGQTGAGKSYSMVGYGKNKGIVPISCEEIFKRIEGETDPDNKYEVTVSMIEIYNEAVQDLLIEPGDRPKKGLEVRESKALGIYIDGVIKRPVDSYPAIEATIEEATNHRTVGSTLMNATSSRAHTVQIIEFKAVRSGAASVSMINLVDLAGSEKAGQTGATGDRLKEGSAINKSLSALGNVIEKLAEKSSGKGKNVLVPYRDSKLTRLLQNALGGSSKTIMICALSPASSNYEETLSTLRYADRAKKIKNTATVNENPQERLMRELKAENQKLKELVESLQGGSMPDAASIREMGARQQEIAAMQSALTEMNMSFEDKMEQEKNRQLASAQKRKQSNVLRSNATFPMLVNLNDDKFLTGRIRHNCPPGRSLIGGLGDDASSSEEDSDDSEDKSSRQDSESEDSDSDAEDPDIIIRAAGVQRNHAIIFNIGNEKTKIYPVNDHCAMLTYVNGRSLSEWLKDAGATQDDDNNDVETNCRHDDQNREGTEENRDGRDQQMDGVDRFKRPEGKGISLTHGSRVAFGDHFFVFIIPSVGDADLFIASGEVDYQSAKQEWQVEQRSTMANRFARSEQLAVDSLCGFSSIRGFHEVLAGRDARIQQQDQEISRLKQQLEAVMAENAMLQGGKPLPAGMQSSIASDSTGVVAAAAGIEAPPAVATRSRRSDSISVSIKTIFGDAINKMKILEASLSTKKHKNEAALIKQVSFNAPSKDRHDDAEMMW